MTEKIGRRFIFGIMIITVITASKGYAFELIRPVVEENKTVSFGQILDTQEKVLGAEEKIEIQELAEKEAEVKQFLAKIDSIDGNVSNSVTSVESVTSDTPTDRSTDLLTNRSTDSTEIPTYRPAEPAGPTPTISAFIGDLNENPKKMYWTIAVLGDSMIDTLGTDLPHLQNLLEREFSDYTFNLLNYGQGGTDMESGLMRLTNQTKYLDKDFPPLLSQKIDILIIESFAYNHWANTPSDLDRQWLTIAKIIETVKEKSPDTKIILSSTIAPNSSKFGDGVLNWPAELKWQSTQATKAYLQNMVNFATSQNYPLADSYHPSLGTNGEGLTTYINVGDNLHPSEEGKLLFSRKIVEAIKEKKLIQ